MLKRHFGIMTGKNIIGVDEVGRGCLAGDVLVCAYTLKQEISEGDLEKLRAVAMDSKAFSSRAGRERSVPLIEEMGVFSFARRSPLEIEASNIRLATLAAMREAAESVRGRIGGPGAAVRVVIDGRDIPAGLAGPVEAMIKGDAKVLEISCASILAKVARDHEMDELAKVWPGYGFERHAGYGTRQHIEAIGALGLCPLHRSWAAKFDVRRCR